ncbi:tetratricopeptide repeat-containing protein kinase family protein, partial [Streptomyces sp. G-5]|uniref:tetratricopeptide repeat-containing protein kinase family protein n=1 Tax=Streptomyces sp. G-5 TaxID=2977231 RepID=UPI0021D24DFB
MATLLRNNWRPSEARAAWIGAKLSAGLAHAHGKQVIHGSIAPDRVLLTEDDVLITHWATATIDGVSSQYREAGSPDAALIAPELRLDHSAGPTEASDVYALGVVLLTMLIGHLPDSARSLNVRPTIVPDIVADGLGRVLRECLARDPHARPSASSVSRGFRAHLKQIDTATIGDIPTVKALHETELSATQAGSKLNRHPESTAPSTHTRPPTPHSVPGAPDSAITAAGSGSFTAWSVRDIASNSYVTHHHYAPGADRPIEWPVTIGPPPQQVSAFQPRDAVRNRIDNARHGGGGMVLAGGGGCGKSQLAASYAHTAIADGTQLVVWTTATDEHAVVTTYARAATAVKVPGLTGTDPTADAQAFLTWLAATDRTWLVILDDITDPDTIQNWWPQGRSGRVLATTRLRDDNRLTAGNRTLIDVDVYTPEESHAYLRQRLTDGGHGYLYDHEAAAGTIEALGRLPLGLGFAAAYMINKRCTTTDYLTRLRDSNSRLDDLLPPDADGYGSPVTAALLISLDAVDEADTTHLAWPLLQVIALLDPAGHPPALWTTPPALQHLQTKLTPTRRRWLARRQQMTLVTAGQASDALACLRTYSLITQDTDGGPIRVHALTARAIRETTPTTGQVATARAVADALMELWPEHDHLDRELAASLRTNTLHLQKHTHPALYQPGTHSAIQQVSRSLKDAGLYSQALEHDQATVHRTTILLGPDHPHTQAARSNLAHSYRDAGRTTEATNLQERTLTDIERILGPDHPHTLLARSNLALSYRDAGRTEEATTLQERVLADRERILGPDHPHTQAARSNLAHSYRDAGRT